MKEIKINKIIDSYFYLCSFVSVLLLISCNSATNQQKIVDSKFSTDKEINANNFAFPEGKLKSLVISFDDGPEHDRILLKKLNEANIVGTFHLNSGRLGKRANWLSTELGYDVFFVKESEVNSIYKGHEISSHTVNHLGLNNQKDSIIKSEVFNDIKKLNKIIKNTNHNAVQGLAYPFGAFDEQVLQSLKALDVKYARTTVATKNFELPTNNFLELNPTCHINDAINYGNYFANLKATKMQLLNVWGHSYEFHNNWQLADSICNLLGNKKDIWYAKTIEMVNYLNAIKALEYKNNSVFNPSKNTSVWIKNKAEKFIELKPNQTLPIHFKSSFVQINTINSLYPDASKDIKFQGDWTKVHYKQRIELFKKGPLNFSDIVFLGNSITEQGGNWAEKVGIKNVKNRGISGDVTDGVLNRLDEITHFKPKTVFLLIGINDLFNLHYQKQIPSTEYVAKNIIKITDSIHQKSPETIIYLQTILPTAEVYMTDYINQVNNIIRNNKIDVNYKLIDLHNEFVNENGLIKPELTSDGTHLNELGYEVWVKTIKDKL
ncbi:polysaccharide deacetylase family protein [Polaribacter haliotis]|uniref:Polysaccharide deacetylase family protein n=1 Tax=Polaribacter haliotis TaxID=1888915 RepID=A0A7L8AFT6_9FLAO|nr:GDSL-type esterase/lipase family protein [Polaribacter haliotis]QOD60875.1 polysaccharide deacetylase family protein [Polaribacter haliotis]